MLKRITKKIHKIKEIGIVGDCRVDSGWSGSPLQVKSMSDSSLQGFQLLLLSLEEVFVAYHFFFQGCKVRVLGELLVFIPTERIQGYATMYPLYGELEK